MPLGLVAVELVVLLDVVVEQVPVEALLVELVAALVVADKQVPFVAQLVVLAAFVVHYPKTVVLVLVVEPLDSDLGSGSRLAVVLQVFVTGMIVLGLDLLYVRLAFEYR